MLKLCPFTKFSGPGVTRKRSVSSIFCTPLSPRFRHGTIFGHLQLFLRSYTLPRITTDVTTKLEVEHEAIRNLWPKRFVCIFAGLEVTKPSLSHAECPMRIPSATGVPFPSARYYCQQNLQHITRPSALSTNQPTLHNLDISCGCLCVESQSISLSVLAQGLAVLLDMYKANPENVAEVELRPMACHPGGPDTAKQRHPADHHNRCPVATLRMQNEIIALVEDLELSGFLSLAPAIYLFMDCLDAKEMEIAWAVSELYCSFETRDGQTRCYQSALVFQIFLERSCNWGRKGRYKRPVSSAVRHVWTIITNLKRVPLQFHITL